MTSKYGGVLWVQISVLLDMPRLTACDGTTVDNNEDQVHVGCWWRHRIISNPNVLIVEGQWLDVQLDIYMVNVYAPQYEEGKQNLWCYIIEFMYSNLGYYIIFGDFNFVRNNFERFGSFFSNINAVYFNDLIANGNLVDVPMGGYKFTRVD
ncbi:cytochrome P450 [Artemisia annua]|uniref:Cytochrome P450 n=1 Tax=Artemisia annua TaxID=35608 RepID=A0A2U1LVW2_ARTAN|nr:cytochrome P450 [Artemisia annua]